MEQATDKEKQISKLIT